MLSLCFLLSSLDKLKFLCNLTHAQGEPQTPYNVNLTKASIMNGFEAL